MSDDSMRTVEVLGVKYKLFKLPATFDETLFTRLDEYIVKSQHNFEQFTLMLAAAREHYVETVNARDRRLYQFMKSKAHSTRATTLKDLARADAIEEISAANTAEAIFKRYEDWKEVGLERLQTFKKLKKE